MNVPLNIRKKEGSVQFFSFLHLHVLLLYAPYLKICNIELWNDPKASETGLNVNCGQIWQVYRDYQPIRGQG